VVGDRADYVSGTDALGTAHAHGHAHQAGLVGRRQTWP
jgi:hypothetical protein